MGDEEKAGSGDSSDLAITASHSPIQAHPLLVAPTTANEINTYSLDIGAVACMALPDVLFEFDCSFVSYEAESILAEMPELRERHRCPRGNLPPVAIFGHADPVGEDDYNKKLSGRRATAIYGLLTHNDQLWAELWDIPHGGDNWTQKKVREKMKAVVGPSAPSDRSALIKAYMQKVYPFKLDKGDFLAKGSDSKLRGDIMGCGEFNPLRILSKSEEKNLPKEERNRQNQPNRRVVIYLFRPGQRVRASEWPCPASQTDALKCHDRFFVTLVKGDDRRKAGADRREHRKLKDTKDDTFACRFYDRISHASPCEELRSPPAPWVYLTLGYDDPEGNRRWLPEYFPVTVRFSPPAGAIRDRNVSMGRDGRLTFPSWDNPGDYWRSFTLCFSPPQIPLFICESPPALASPPVPPFSRYGTASSSPPIGFERFFSLPRQWAMRQADWRMGPDGFSGNGEFLSPPHVIQHTQRRADIGSLASPVGFILNPHWHYLRYEYYDRYYGNAHLDSPPRTALSRRISTLPMRVAGFRNDAGATGSPPDVVSNWTISLADPPDSGNLLQSVPFILRRNQDGTVLSPPDGASLGLRFRTPQDAHIYAQSESERLLIFSPPPVPGPERLRYYDLPRMWKSRGYYTRRLVSSPPAPGKFFRDLTAAEISQSEQREQPLVFSLDDLVLVAGNPASATVSAALATPATRAAIFNHRFDDRIPGSTGQGLYRLLSPPGPDTFDLPRSDVTIANNYIYDYPDWTRLVIAQGNLFDVFNQRVPEGISPPGVVGARAAVRWVDGTAPFPGISMFLPAPGNTWVAAPDNNPVPGRRFSPPHTARTDLPGTNPITSIQPFFQQRPPWPGWRFDESDLQIGRYDIALLRCADVREGNEVAVNFNYFRHHFTYMSPPPMPAPAVLPTSREHYALLLCQNVANRWSGNEAGFSENRAVFHPRTSPPAPSPPPLATDAVWWPQSVRLNQAHSTLNFPPGGRDNRSGLLGTGDTGPDSYQEHPGTDPQPFLQHWFTAAHETGHMGGLPDEYNERWNSQSYGQASFASLLPGDAYETDGRDDVAPLSSPQASMMNGNKHLRNRYFWHGAEWVRRIVNHPLEVSLGPDYQDYWLPEHPETAQGHTYYPWPIAHRVPAPASPRAGYEMYLMPFGRDHFSQRVVGGGPPNGPFDGILVIAVKFRCNMPSWANVGTRNMWRTDFLNRMQGGVRLHMNNKWWVEGSVNYGAPAKVWRFNKCLLHFAAQVVVANYPDGTPAEAANATRILNIYGYDFRVRVNIVGAAAAVWAGNQLTITLDADQNNMELFARHYPRSILGVDIAPAAVTTAQLTPIVQQVIPGAIVHTL